jgi:diphthamide biosynthesis protein 7
MIIFFSDFMHLYYSTLTLYMLHALQHNKVWITAFNYWDPALFVTGADDGKLKGWDLRSDCSKPTYTNSAHHAGVCSAQWNPHREHCFATGSYDNNLRIWDDRMMRREPLCQLDTGGGVWRIKWHPNPTFYNVVATASMRGGCKVLHVDGDLPTPSLSLKCGTDYLEHGSENLSYGLDWVCNYSEFSEDKECNRTLASASFYNSEMRVWTTSL